jgi:hypothetical protein
MSTHRLIVFTEPKSGQEAEYNKWYNEVHLKEVLEIEGFVAAQRFEIAPTQIGGGGEPTGGRYLAIYEIEAESLEDALEKLNAGAGTMNMSDALDLGSAAATAYSAIGDRELSA